MAEVATWPYLIDGPGDGEVLPPTHGGACEYPDPESDAGLMSERATLYREVKVIVIPDELAVRCYVATSEDPYANPGLLAYQAMARSAVARLA